MIPGDTQEQIKGLRDDLLTVRAEANERIVHIELAFRKYLNEVSDNMAARDAALAILNKR
jgi:hypothetical protein